MAFIMARGDSPAAATTYEPSFAVSVSDPNPGAAADVIIDFSLEKPDAFPNVRTRSSTQFFPRSWGVHVPETDEEKLARVGGVGGTFNALSTLGVIGGSCNFALPVNFTLYDATVDTGNLTSALDIAGDVHPGGVGFSGQFVSDPDTISPPGDLNMPLVRFNANEKHRDWSFNNGLVYRDGDNSGRVSAGDTRLYTPRSWTEDMPDDHIYYPELGAGTVVKAGDPDLGVALFAFWPIQKHADADGNGQMDPGEGIYQDMDQPWLNSVTYGDRRLFEFGALKTYNTTVKDLALPGGVSRYPDFLNELFQRFGVEGAPLARVYGQQQVYGTPVPLNIVTFRPGQLPGYPAQLGYANVVILLNPVAPVEMASLAQVNDLCTPLSLTATNFGVSVDNPGSARDEGGHVRLTNPKAEKSHEFTLVTTSQPDADDDGIENMLDTCPFDPNTQDIEGRGAGLGDKEDDYLDGACDPEPLRNTRLKLNDNDEDKDNYGNLADNCSVIPNGVEDLGMNSLPLNEFVFFWVTKGELIGPDNQADADADDIGDACEGSEHGPQCANDADDDGDGTINDGCPRRGDTYEESGAQCANNLDDDGDGLVNDGCPWVPNAERGWLGECDNNLDDDGDGKVNDGCTPWAETGPQCLNNIDDDGDGKVNDGCEPFALRSYSRDDGSDNAQCDNDIDDDGDGYVNDGCRAKNPGTESGSQCLNNVDDDGDGWVNDYCPAQGEVSEGLMQCDNDLDDDGDGRVNEGCYYSAGFGVVDGRAETGGECLNDLSDDGDIKVNDGCPTVYGGRAEAGDECLNDTDDDGDGWVNDGCPRVGGWGQQEWQFPQWGYRQCENNLDDDGDGVVNDGCPKFPAQEYESGAACDNNLDDDLDGVVNDGCPALVHENLWSDNYCLNNIDDDGDGYVNDGCPTVPRRDGLQVPPESEMIYSGWCGNAVDDDLDGYVNDGCPMLNSVGAVETGDQCANAADDDGDGWVNDGCPAVDPGDVAKTTITGHLHVLTLTQGVTIAKHGVKLDDLDGKENVAAGGSANYKVSLENKSDSAEDAVVGLRVLGGCGDVSGPSTVHVNGDASANANFTVDFSGCADGEYTVQADACHGDDADAGLFGVGDCPGASDGLADTNQLDDAPRSLTVVVGSP